MGKPHFEGSAIKALDPKDRFGLPPEYRRRLTGEVVVCPGPSRYIELRGLDEWDDYKALIERKASTGPRTRRQLRRHVLGDAEHVTVDSQGRVRIHADLLDWAQLAQRDEDGCREVKIIGVGDHLELWSVDAYRAYRDSMADDFEAAYDEMIAEEQRDDSADKASGSDEE